MLIAGISNVNGYYSEKYTKVINNQNTQNVDNAFGDKVEETSKTSRALNTSDSTKSSGNVTMSFPPSAYDKFAYQAFEGKNKEDMTLDEYKQYISNEIANLPVNASTRLNFSGSLIIKEEAFERMKEDPEYERTVINMLREGFNVQMPLYAPSYCVQVIGGTMEETYGFGIPLNNSSANGINSFNEKSWWEKRHEKMEELLEGQAKKAQQKRAAQKEAQMQELLAYQQQKRIAYSNFSAGEYQSAENILESAVSIMPPETVSKAIEAYDKNIVYGNDLF